MTFAKHVSEYAAIRAGFNYPDASFGYEEKGKIIMVYSTNIRGTNIVVVEVRRLSRNDGVRYDFYFGVLPDKSRMEYSSGAEAVNEFRENIDQIITRRNRIAARDLEMRITGAVKEAEAS